MQKNYYINGDKVSGERFYTDMNDNFNIGIPYNISEEADGIYMTYQMICEGCQ